MNIKPLGSRVLLLKEAPETKTASGLYIPESVNKDTTVGIVVEVGSDVSNKDLCGEKVMYDKYAGVAVQKDGKDLLILQESDIIAIVQE